MRKELENPNGGGKQESIEEKKSGKKEQIYQRGGPFEGKEEGGKVESVNYVDQENTGQRMEKTNPSLVARRERNQISNNLGWRGSQRVEGVPFQPSNQR